MQDEDDRPQEEDVAAQIALLSSTLDSESDDNRLAHIRQINELCFAARDRAKAAIPILAACLSDPDDEIGECALYGLSWCAPASMEILIDCLHSPDARVRQRACHALGNIGDSALPACDAVRALLNDQNQSVCLRAAWALGLMHDTSARTTDALFIMATSSDAKVRSSAFHALQNVAQRLVDPAQLRARQTMIIEALGDMDEEVRRWACDVVAFLQLDTAHHADLLMRRLAIEPSYEARKSAIRQLTELASATDLTSHLPLMCRIVNRGEKDAPDMCNLLASLGPSARSAVPCLTEALRSDDGFLVIAAAKAIWSIDRRVDESLPALEGIFEHHDESVCDAICEIGPAAAPLAYKLIEALQTESWDLQWAAADALGAIASSDPQILEQLTAALAHPSPLVSSAAANALGKLGAPAVPTLMAILNNADDNRGEYAADALGRMGRHAAPAADLLKRNLTSPRFALAAWSAIALARATGDVAAVPLLVQLLGRSDRSDLRHQAALGIATIGPPAIAALDALRIALDDSEDEVRAAAAGALTAVNAKSN